MKSLLNKIYYKVAKLFYSGEKYASSFNIDIARKKGVKVGKDCRFYSTNFSTEPYLVEIGNHVTITAGVRFVTHDGAAWVLRGLDKKYEKTNILGKITIGNNVFIGFNSIILPGVEIGDNTVIAAGSVVTKSFTGNSIIGGVPAKKIKDLEEYIKINEKHLVDTKGLNSEEKKHFVLNKMDSKQLKQK
ncbi:acyltransferase [Gracilibacillus sp. S3-1-1]|uniref:Acyltransferase n=1 Tax=Gracilibacillus pellucidus TaxID=3095368 RepID=A0ACC6M815_9BACI|nr:acyltransferase [Gracilibacillus sp. S3-1-1]MDX8047128.1 acyltransferase [Gracilibacillus sp. S3-1-1]